MSSRTWSRLSGVALLIGGLLTLVFATILYQIAVANDTKLYTSLQSPGLHSLWWLLLNLMGMLGSVLLLIGLPAVYAYEAKRAGWLGLVGLVLIFCAVLLTGVFGVALNQFGIWFLDMDASQLVTGAGTPAMDWLFIVDSAIFIAGSILLGLALVRAGETLVEGADVAIGLAFIIAGLLSLVHLVPTSPESIWPLPELGSGVAVAAFSLGLAACGLVLLRREGTRTVLSAPPTAEHHSADVRS